VPAAAAAAAAAAAGDTPGGVKDRMEEEERERGVDTNDGGARGGVSVKLERRTRSVGRHPPTWAGSGRGAMAAEWGGGRGEREGRARE